MHEKRYVEPVDIIASFRDAMLAANIRAPSHIDADGQLHRFHIEGDRAGTRNGWYVLYADAISHGIFGSWKTGVTGNWSSKSRMTLQERLQERARIQQKRQEQVEALRTEQLATAKLCLARWQRYPDADPGHPYLVKKQIKPYGAKQITDILALPIVDVSGKLWSLQYITADGSKVLCLHGAKKGNFIPVHNSLHKGIKILICEGFATGVSLAELEPEACVIAAIDAGNLEPVAVAIRKQWPNNDIVICADDDRNQSRNIGLIKAEQAARASHARLIKPQWPTDAPLELSDFNDWMSWFSSKEGVACYVQL